MSSSSIVAITIKVHKPFLGDQGSPNTETKTKLGLKKVGGRYAFPVKTAWWQKSIKDAAQILGISSYVNLEAIAVPTWVYTTTEVVDHTRTWKQHGTKQIQVFESVPENATLLFSISILPESEIQLSQIAAQLNKLAQPTLSDIENIFSCIGEYIGLSPFGSKFGFGRFEVQSCCYSDSNTHGNSNTNNSLDKT